MSHERHCIIDQTYQYSLYLLFHQRSRNHIDRCYTRAASSSSGRQIKMMSICLRRRRLTTYAAVVSYFLINLIREERLVTMRAEQSSRNHICSWESHRKGVMYISYDAMKQLLHLSDISNNSRCMRRFYSTDLGYGNLADSAECHNINYGRWFLSHLHATNYDFCSDILSFDLFLC